MTGVRTERLRVAANAGAEVVVHSPNKGKGMAFKTGFEAAEGADIIVTMDSDGQHNPADIPKLVAPILKGEADMVNGSRYLIWSCHRYACLPSAGANHSGQGYHH